MSHRDPPHTPDGLPPQDPRLQAALRHAPDNELAPPPDLSAAITAAARAAVRSGTPSAHPRPGLLQALRDFWQGLVAPRSVWAGGAAAMVVAGLTISIWMGEPIPPAVVAEAPPPAPQEALPKEAAPAAPARDLGPAPPPEQAVTRLAERAQRPEVLAKPAAPQAFPGTAAPGREARAAAGDAAPPPPAPSPMPAPAAVAAAPAPAPAPAVVTPPAAAAPAKRPAELMASADRADAATTPAPSPRSPPLAGQALNQAQDSRGAAAKSAAPAERPPSLGALLGGAGAVSESDRSALQLLDTVTRQRWQRQSDAVGERDAPLRQWAAPAGVSGLRIDADGARWTEPDGRRWFAPLDTAAVNRLRALF